MRFALAVLVGCTASSPPPKEPKPDPVEPEHVRRAKLVAAQNERLDEQATALAATCESHPAKPRCTPSCYTPEPADTRGKRTGAVEITHRVCQRDDTYVLLDEGATLEVRPARRFPTASKPKTWQGDVEAAVKVALEPELARGDVIKVTGDWKPTTINNESLRCTSISHFTRLTKPLDACGSKGATVCEASKNHAVHGINVVHHRLFEARRFQAERRDSECQHAAHEAVAVARGLPRWRQYVTLNTGQWKAAKRYRTRYDGILDEDTLFTTAIALGKEAEQIYAACGGVTKTSAADEQSFHTCW